jgi:two-component system, sensor histidine kinase
MASQANDRPMFNAPPNVPADVVFAEQIKVLFVSHPYGAFGAIIAVNFMVIVLWPKVAITPLLSWAALVIGIEIFGLYHHYEYNDFRNFRITAPPELTATKRWSRDYVIAAGIAGFFWGLAAFLLDVPDSPAYQMLVILALCLNISFCAVALAIHLPALLSFTMGLVVPVIAKQLMVGNRVSYIIAMAILLWTVLCMGVANRLNRVLLRSLRLRLENEALTKQFEALVSQLMFRTQEAERANQAKTRFLAAASHDLRQPMHAIGLFVGTLRTKIHYPEVRQIVDKIQASVVAMEALFFDLLDISRLDAGSIVANVRSFSLTEMFDRVALEFGPQAQDKDIRFDVIRSTASVKSDPILLNRIVNNLVSNAIRYTREGRVLLGCRRTENGIRIEVRDTGIGIPEEHLDDIFQEFFQLQNPDRDRTKGLGLGLSIVQRHASLLDHPIRVSSTPGKGSCFSISLPIGVAQQQPTVANAKLSVPRELVGAFIVVVDDESDVREGMESLLSAWQCLVVTASSGFDAVKQLRRHERAPDLVICDFKLLNGETGLDAIRTLRQALQQIVPVVLITGDIEPARLREAANEGLTLLHKPVEPDKLQVAMIDALRRADQLNPA